MQEHPALSAQEEAVLGHLKLEMSVFCLAYLSIPGDGTTRRQNFLLVSDKTVVSWNHQSSYGGYPCGEFTDASVYRGGADGNGECAGSHAGQSEFESRLHLIIAV